MLNAIWIFMILSAIIFGAFSGSMEAVTRESVASAKTAVTLSLGLIGVMAFWLGMMNIAKEAGMMDWLAEKLRPIMKRLFPDVPSEHPAMSAMIMNISANMLGLGNAATPFGIKAMMELEKLNPRPGTATDSMALFLAINTSNVALFPTGVIAIRAAMGSEDPTGIVFTTFFATAVSTLTAVFFAKLLQRLPRYRRELISTKLSESSSAMERGDSPSSIEKKEHLSGGKNDSTADGPDFTEGQPNGNGKRGADAKDAETGKNSEDMDGDLNAKKGNRKIVGAVSSGQRTGTELNFMGRMLSWFFWTAFLLGIGFTVYNNYTLYIGEGIGIFSVGPVGGWGFILLDGPGFFALFRNVLSFWLLPALMAWLILYGVSRGVRVYDALVAGAKEGFEVAVRIIPFLVAILVAIGMFRASGALDLLIATLAPVTKFFGVPPEVLPMAVLRPLSGSGAFGVMAETMRNYGPDSLIGYMVSTFQGSTETTFYVLAVYFGAAGIKRVRHTVLACLLADAAGIIAAIWICKVMFS